MEKQKTQKNQHTIKVEEHIWQTDIIQLQDLLLSYSDWDGKILVKEEINRSMEQTLYDTKCMIFRERQKYRESKNISDCQELEWESDE